MVTYAIIDNLASCHTRICAEEHYKKEIHVIEIYETEY
jgi:hypothetical protein